MKNIKINALANLMVNILNILFPLITNPYLTRILNKTEFGYFNIANTWVSFFIPIAAFGIYNYGIRSVSQIKNNNKKLNEVFSKLFYASLLTSIMTTIIFIVVVNFETNIPENYKILYFILGFQIIFQFLNIEWMNEAFENYTFILYKTLVIRIIMLASIFIFVKTENDIIPYSIIMTVITILNFLLSFIWIKKDVRFIKIPIKHIFSTITGLIAMLLMANANMLYTLLDRLFLGNTAFPEYVSYYTIGMSITMLIANVIGGAISVSIPRLGYYLGEKKYTEYENLINTGSSLFFFLIVPLSFGLTVLGTYATLIYAGTEYIEAGVVTSIFAIRTIIWAIEIILGKQIVFVNGYENKLTLYYFIGGGINFLLNSLLFIFHIYTPMFYISTTILAEIIVVLYEIRFITKKKLIQLKPIFKTLSKYILISTSFIPIYFICKFIFKPELIINLTLIKMILTTIILCSTVYISTLYITKDKILQQAINMIKEKL